MLEVYQKSLELFDYRCGLNPSHIAGKTPHHILPRGAGGKDDITNLIPLCSQCHGKIHREGTRKWRDKLGSIVHKRMEGKSILDMV